MKRLLIVSSVLALAASAFAAGEKPLALTPAQQALLSRPYLQLTPAERKERACAAELKFLIEDGGAMPFPGTPHGEIAVVNLQKRVPVERLTAFRQAFTGMMEYTVTFYDKPAEGVVTIRLVDDPAGRDALVVYPDRGAADVNVAVLAADDPKPAFLAARTRKEMLRAFACATAGSSYGTPLFAKLRKGVKTLDDIAGEEFPLDVIMRTAKFLEASGMKPVQHSSYREVIESGYDIAPTNAYQKAIWDEVHQLPTKPIKIVPPNRKK